MSQATNKYKKALLQIVALMANNDGYPEFECYNDNTDFIKENIINENASYKDKVIDILSKYDLVSSDFTHVSSDRSEGSGDYDGYEVVIRVKDELYMFEGTYNSWSGTEMDWYTCYQVEEVEETIVVLRKLK